MTTREDEMVDRLQKSVAPFEQMDGRRAASFTTVDDVRGAIEALTALSSERALLVEAAKAVLASWDRNTHKREEFVRNEQMGDYWSPAAAMVDSEYIAGLRAALTGVTGG